MPKKQGKQNQKRLVVSIRHVATPDGNARLSRVIDILLKAAARDALRSKGNPANAEKGKPPCQAPAEDALTGGAEESSSYE